MPFEDRENSNSKNCESEDSEKGLEEQVTRSEFEKYIMFTNKEISIERVTPRYCPNTIE